MSFDNFRPNPKPAKKEKELPKRIRARSKKWKAMTPEELEYILIAKTLGCIIREKAIEIQDYCEGDIEFNHHTDGGRRQGHKEGFPLCKSHHQYGKINVKMKKTFRPIYGMETELIEKTKRLVLTIMEKENGDQVQNH